MTGSKRRVGRGRADFARRLLEGLESRVLLAVTPVSGGGTASANGAALQAAINAAAPGDTLILDAGATYEGNFTLPNKVGNTTVTIQSSALASLPAGLRVGPAQAALMPKLKIPASNPSATGVLRTLTSAHDYTFLGIEFTPTAAVSDQFSDFIALGTVGTAQDTLAEVPLRFTFDRCYIHGAVGVNQKRGIGLNSDTTTISNSYLSEWHSDLQDSQAIGGFNGPGNYTITNNYIEGSTENILFGGANATIPNLVPTNIVVQGNYFSKPRSWNPMDPSYVAPLSGKPYWVKNIFELKTGANVTISQNIFENNWSSVDQFGFGIVFTPRGQNGGNPQATIHDVQFTNNVVRHSGAGVNILGSDDGGASGSSHDINIQNNLFYDLGGPVWGVKGGQAFQLIKGGSVTSDNITFDHNTVFETWKPMSIGTTGTNDLTFTNNVIYRAMEGFQGSSLSEGNNALGTFTGVTTFTKNVIVEGNSSSYSNYAGNFFPVNGDAVKILDFAGERFTLEAGSPYKGVGTGGTDPGVDYASLAPEFIPVGTGMMGYWKFDEGSGGSATDWTGNGRTGTLSGTTLPTWTASGGQTRGGLTFNGTTAYVAAPTFAPPTNLTLAAWVKPDDHTGTASTILSKGDGEFSLAINSSGFLTVTVAGVTLTDASFNFYSAANKNKWYYVSATFDDAANVMRLYRNGVQVGTVANNGSMAASGLALWIGRDVQTNSGSFLGTLDEVRVMNRALSAADMATLYAGYGPQVNYITPQFPPPAWYTSPVGVGATSSKTSTFSTFAVSHYTNSALTFTWSVGTGPAGTTPGGPLAPTFTNNGTNAGKNTTATFKAAGTYFLKLTVTDPSGMSTSVLAPGLTITQVLSGVTVSPTPVNVANGTTQQFTATTIDQFGLPMASQPGSFTWSLTSGIGSVNSSGLYTAPGSGTGTANVRAVSGAFNGNAAVTVVTKPVVSSIVRTNANPTNAGTVNFTVTFSEGVTGVDAGDFLAVTSGVSGASIGTVTGSGTTWNVPVNTGTGDGTLGLNLVDDDTIKSAASLVALGGPGAANGNLTGQVYTVDKTLPVVSISSPTAAALISGTTPTIAGTGGIASGDSSTITVKIYAGNTATGSPVSTFTTTANGTGAFSVSAPSLPEGRYTVQVSQADAAGNVGLSSAVSYTIYNTIAGDANGDGTVDFSDFVVLSNNFGVNSASGVSIGDFNFDGVVDFGDFVILSNNFGQTASFTFQSSVVTATPTGASSQTAEEGVLAGSVVEDKVGKNKKLDKANAKAKKAS